MKIESISEGISKTGSRFLLCSVLAQRGKQIHKSHNAGAALMARSFSQALDEVISGQLHYVHITPDETDSKSAEGEESNSSSAAKG